VKCKGIGYPPYDFMTNFPKTKIKLAIEVVETTEGKHHVGFDLIENNVTLKEVSLLLYKLNQIQLDFLDREWEQGGEGYEIIEESTTHP